MDKDKMMERQAVMGRDLIETFARILNIMICWFKVIRKSTLILDHTDPNFAICQSSVKFVIFCPQKYLCIKKEGILPTFYTWSVGGAKIGTMQHCSKNIHDVVQNGPCAFLKRKWLRSS